MLIRILPAEIYSLYMQYGATYEKVYERSAIDFLTDSVSYIIFTIIFQCTKYSAYKFFMNRTLIGNTMQTELN